VRYLRSAGARSCMSRAGSLVDSIGAVCAGASAAAARTGSQSGYHHSPSSPTRPEPRSRRTAVSSATGGWRVGTWPGPKQLLIRRFTAAAERTGRADHLTRGVGRCGAGPARPGDDPGDRAGPGAIDDAALCAE
jgi:hypothetical protein